MPQIDPLNAEFARLLNKSGWHQAEAARQLDVSPSVVTRYLNGETRPSLTTLKLFKIMIGDMEPIPGERAFSSELKEGMRPMEADERALLTLLQQVDEPSRRELIRHFSALAGLVGRPLATRYPKAKKEP